MTRRSHTLVSLCAFFLSIMLFPSTAWLQEKPAPSAPAEQPNAAMNAQESAALRDGRYTVKQGDTLWDISNSFLKDPFLWPLIWKDNPAIANPDLIYPGQALTIPSLAPIERAMQTPSAPAAAVVTEAAIPSQNPVEPSAVQTPVARAVSTPEPAQVEIPARSTLVIPEKAAIPLVDKYAMQSAGFISTDTYQDKIIGSQEPKTILGVRDIVFLKFASPENVNVGDKFSILAPMNTVKHPKTGKNFGTLFKVVGILQVTGKAPDTLVAAVIKTSFEDIALGNFLTPYQEPSLFYSIPEKGGRTISGSILEVTDSRTINGHFNVVYLDKGSADGIKPGDRFTVSPDAEKKGFPDKVIGNLMVILVKEETATAVVQAGVDPVEKGNKVNLRQ